MEQKETEVNKDRYYQAIKDVLKDGTLTARQVGERVFTRFGLGEGNRSSVQPRLVELTYSGEVETDGKIFDEYTRKNVFAYKLT